MENKLAQVSKSFVINQGRGSSVVEQPIRNRQVVGSTPTLGSTFRLVRPGDIGDRSYRRHRLHFWAKRVVERLQSFFLQIDVAEIVLHKADRETPSSTSLIPRACPAKTVMILIVLRCRQMRPQL